MLTTKRIHRLHQQWPRLGVGGRGDWAVGNNEDPPRDERNPEAQKRYASTNDTICRVGQYVRRKPHRLIRLQPPIRLPVVGAGRVEDKLIPGTVILLRCTQPHAHVAVAPVDSPWL